MGLLINDLQYGKSVLIHHRWESCRCVYVQGMSMSAIGDSSLVSLLSRGQGGGGAMGHSNRLLRCMFWFADTAREKKY